jgi:dipeptidyl-peptidase 4
MSRLSLLLVALFAVPAVTQPQQPDPAKLTLDRLFASDDFKGDPAPAVKWLAGGAYTTLVPSKGAQGCERHRSVRYGW